MTELSPLGVQQFSASSLEAFYNSLRFAREQSQRVPDIHRLRKPGIAKDYLKNDVVLLVHLGLADPSHRYCFVFYRVPIGPKDLQHLNGLPSDSAVLNRADVGICGDADRVFSIGDCGESTDKVVVGGTRIRSRIWMMRREYVPEPLIDESFFEQTFKVRLVCGPREIGLVQLRAAEDALSSKDRLIESVPSVNQCAVGVPAEVVGERRGQPDFLDVFSSLSISLGDNFYRIWAEESISDSFEFTESFLCPTDGLLRYGKRLVDTVHAPPTT